MLKSVFLIILGFVLLIKGADFLVDGASNTAKKFHIPEIIIGLTIVSIGTSMPELFVSITSTLNGSSDMAIGNIIGSNLCNLLLILGISAIIRPVEFQKETKLIEIPTTLILTIIFMIICNTENAITREEALILIALFVIFVIYTIIMGKRGEKFNTDNTIIEIRSGEENQISILKNMILIILGILGLKIGGDFVVDNSIIVANYFNISEKVISLTILAIGTSLPELVTSVTAACKGNSDIAIGNIIGSNIFNMLLIIGASAVIAPLSYNITYNVQMAILIVAILILALFPLIPPKNKMSRMNGLVYFLMYVIYMAMLFLV